MSKTDVLTRKDMKEPDKFQQAATQAASWIAARRRRVVAIGAAAVAVVLVVAIASSVQARRAERAGAAAADLLGIVSGDVSAVELPGTPGPFFKTEEEKQRAIVAAADRVVSEYGGTPAAAIAALSAGAAHLKL